MNTFHKDLITISEIDNKIHILFADNIPHKYKLNMKIYIKGELWCVTKNLRNFVRLPNDSNIGMEQYHSGVGYRVHPKPRVHGRW